MIGGYLVKVETIEEHNFLADGKFHLNQFGHNNWIGLSDLAKDGVYRWTDGSRANFTMWRRGQPDRWRNEEYCVHMFDDKGLWEEKGLWNDVNCENSYRFICERNKTVS